MVGEANKALKFDVKRTINMGNRMDLKINERGKGDVKPRGHIFVPKIGTEERIM